MPRRRRPRSVYFRAVSGAALAALCSLALVAVLAVVMKFAQLSDELVVALNQLIKILSIGVGCLHFTAAGERGLPGGALLGTLYMAAGAGIYLLLGGEGFSAAAMFGDLGMGAVAGALLGFLLLQLRQRRAQTALKT